MRRRVLLVRHNLHVQDKRLRADQLYQYAMAVILPGNEQFIFVSSEGQGWSNGPNPLPDESNHNGRPYTLSADWLRRNLSYIAKIDDPSDVWVAKRVLWVPEPEGEVH
jgi:hypothetical protein